MAQCVLQTCEDISIHALREEGDPAMIPAFRRRCYFYPRPPRGGRRAFPQHIAGQGPGISIHALREEGDRERIAGGLHVLVISIHALREEGDAALLDKLMQADMISIHALREEGDRCCTAPRPACKRFLSTPSARRATAS